MKRIETTTKINKGQDLKLTSVAGLQDLSEVESQTIQGGFTLIVLLRGKGKD